MKLLALVIGMILLIFVEILRVYFIMPFPGSQEDETIRIAYFLQNNINYFRLLGGIIIAYPVIYYFRNGSRAFAITLAVVLGFYAVVFYMFNFRFLADKMFLPTKTQLSLDAESNRKVSPHQLVIGVTIGDQSRAYPIEIIGYHHQVRDTIAGELIMVTYCTVCRTGRVYSPVVKGKPENFRLVGMDHFNAMFEDSQTKSWWRQVNGEAIVGSLMGEKLKEIPSEQMSLSVWVNLHPGTTILQPDSIFKEAYESIENYDEGKQKGNLTRRDSTSWNEKSWIVGIQIGMDAKAYDWNDLQKLRLINDVVGHRPVLVLANADSVSFHSFDRTVEGQVLSFTMSDVNKITDTQGGSVWSWNGQCVSGPLQGKVLTPIQSYQEYWHSWRTFRPQTVKYSPTSNP